MIKAGFTAVSILALWLGIQEYASVKAVTHDSVLALMRMMFMMALVYGSSYMLYLGGPCLKAILSRRKMAAAGISREQYDDMCARESQKTTDRKEEMMKALTDYASLTFSRIIPAEQIEIIVENLQLLSQEKDASRGISQRINGVTSNDLYHFGWNVGKRLKRTNIQIAWFLKGTFRGMLDDVSVDTVQTKLANKEGNFTLKLIPLNQELVPHIFPISA